MLEPDGSSLALIPTLTCPARFLPTLSACSRDAPALSPCLSQSRVVSSVAQIHQETFAQRQTDKQKM